MEADAIVLFPGGFGTQDEGFEVLTLLQTGKAPPMPVVLMELPGDGYWKSWDRLVRQEMLGRGFISPEDLSFYRVAQSPEEAADWIKLYYTTFHSMRRVRGRMVLRLEKELPDEDVVMLNEMFPDLLRSGKIYKTAPLREETDEPALLTKPRLAFAHNNSSAGRLHQMILQINEMGSWL